MDGLAQKHLTFLLVGKSGQLGSRISDHLSAHGHEVVSPLRLTNTKLAEFRNDIDLDATIELMAWDVVVNASSPNAGLANRDPRGAMDWSRKRAEDLNLLLEHSALKRGVHLSSSQVYGTKLEGLVDESFVPRGLSGYGSMHRELEAYLLQGAKWLILRLSNVFGAPGSHGKVDESLFTHSIVRSLLRSQHATVTANPGTRRDFLPASSVAAAVNWGSSVHLSKSLAVNLAFGQSLTLKEWSTIILKATNQSGHPGRITLERDPELTSDYQISIQMIRNMGFNQTSHRFDELLHLIDYWLSEGSA